MIKHASAFIETLGNSAGTINTYRYGLERFTAFVATRKGATYTNKVLVNFYTWLISEEYAPATINNYLAALRRFLTWLEANEMIGGAFVLSKAESKLKVIKSHRRIATAGKEADPRLPEILEHFDGMPTKDQTFKAQLIIFRARALMHTLYSTAARVTEVLSLTRALVGYDGKKIRSEVMITGKGDQRRIVLINARARAAIMAYLQKRGDSYAPLFISHGRGNGRRLLRASVNRTITGAAAAVGIKSRLHPHSFRHYRAQQMARAGMALEHVQAYLGHVDIATTRRIYAPQLNIKQVVKQIEMLGL